MDFKILFHRPIRWPFVVVSVSSRHKCRGCGAGLLKPRQAPCNLEWSMLVIVPIGT